MDLWVVHRRWPRAMVIVALVLTLPALWTGFVADDYIHRAIHLDVPGFPGPFDMFAFEMGSSDRDVATSVAFPWWAADDLKLAFWRPLTAFTHVVDYALWPDSAWLMHLHSVGWYLALVAVVAFLFYQLQSNRWEAGIALFLYATSHTHAVPVFFLANRNAVLGAFFGVAAIALHHRSRSQGLRIAALLAPLALLLGLLANEGAIATCAYLLAYAICLDRAPWRRRIVSLVPFAAVVIGWRVVYQLLGYGAYASAAYIDPVRSPVEFLDAVVTRAPLLLLGQWLFPPSDITSVLPAPLLQALWWAAVVFFALLSALLTPVLRREATARFWCAGMMLSLIPSCATVPADRMLLFSGIGGAVLLAQAVNAIRQGALTPASARLRRVAQRIVFDVIIATHFVVSPLGLPIRIATNADVFDELTNGVEGLAADATLSSKLVVLVADVMFTGSYLPALRALAGQPPVGQLLVLAPVEDRFDTVVLRRPDTHTLVMDVEDRYQWFLERDDAHPFRVGQTVRFGRVHVEIQRIGRGGRPTRVAFQFDTPLDDPSIVWFGRSEPPSVNPIPPRARYPRRAPPLVGRTESVR